MGWNQKRKEVFMAKVICEVVVKVVKIASRCQGFINKLFDGKLATVCAEPVLLAKVIEAGDSIAEHYENRDFSKAVREIMALADKANQYIAQQAPWALAKDPSNHAQVHAVCSVVLNMFRQLITYLAPLLPVTVAASQQFLTV